MQATALQFKIRGIFEPIKENQFQEYLEFTINRQNTLNFHEFQRNVGISRKQWDLFKEANIDVEIEWAVE